MNLVYIRSEKCDGEELAEIRAVAMKSSLVAIGRYYELRVRQRFLENFDPASTSKVFLNDRLVGFYAILEKYECWYLDHFYVHPEFQNQGIGTEIMDRMKDSLTQAGRPLRLGALRDSGANAYYQKQGFKRTHESEFDIYYEYEFC